jgi:hypothetical protein
MAVDMKIMVFFDVPPCSVEIYRSFGLTTASIIRAIPEDEGRKNLVASVGFYVSTRRNIPEGCHLSK